MYSKSFCTCELQTQVTRLWVKRWLSVLDTTQSTLNTTKSKQSIYSISLSQYLYVCISQLFDQKTAQPKWTQQTVTLSSVVLSIIQHEAGPVERKHAESCACFFSTSPIHSLAQWAVMYVSYAVCILVPHPFAHWLSEQWCMCLMLYVI